MTAEVLAPVVAALGNSAAARRARVKKQLRDKHGKWIEMGGGVRWTAGSGNEYFGVVEGFSGSYAVVGQVKYQKPDGSSGTIDAQQKVASNIITAVKIKASLSDKPTQIDTAGPAVAPSAQKSADELGYDPNDDKVENLAELNSLPPGAVVSIGTDDVTGDPVVFVKGVDNIWYDIDNPDDDQLSLWPAEFESSGLFKSPGVLIVPEGSEPQFQDDLPDNDLNDEQSASELTSPAGVKATDVPDSSLKPMAISGEPALSGANISSDELDEIVGAFYEYFHGGYSSINGALRGDNAPAGEMLQTIEHLDTVVSLSKTSAPVTLYRGVKGELVDQLQPGATITDSGFMSTTYDPGVAANFASGDKSALIEVQVPAGTNYLDMTQFGEYHDPDGWDPYADEGEILLSRGSQFRVTAVAVDSDGRTRVSAELLPLGEAGETQEPSELTSEQLDEINSEVTDAYEQAEFDAAGEEELQPAVPGGDSGAGAPELPGSGDLDGGDSGDGDSADVNAGGTGDSGDGGAAAEGAEDLDKPSWFGDNFGEEDSLSAWAAPLSAAELNDPDKMKEIVTDYYGDLGYKRLNSLLRSESGLEALNGDDMYAVSVLDDLVAADSAQTPTKLYRGLSAEWAADLDVGVEIVDNAFVSTSLNPTVAEGFLNEAGKGPNAVIMEITAAPGTPAYFMSGVREYDPAEGSEQEVILGRGTRIRVTDVDVVESPTDGILYTRISAQVVAPGDEGKAPAPESADVELDELAEPDAQWDPISESDLPPLDEPEPAPAITSVAGWQKVGPQAGSNPGGVYDNGTGQKFYVKKSKSDDHARNEVLAARLYAAAGVQHAALDLVEVDGAGKLGTASPIIDGAQQDLTQKLYDEAYLDKVREGFAVDAWLANWDVVGLVYDNIVTAPDSGDPVRIDPGGALIFRAQGAKKGSAFGDTVGELETLRTMGTAAEVFGGMSDADVTASAARVAKVTPEEIDEIVDSVGFDDSTAMMLKNRLKARREDLLTKVNWQEPAEESGPTPTSWEDSTFGNFSLAAYFNEKASEDPFFDLDDAMREYALNFYTKTGHIGLNSAMRGFDEMTPYFEAIETQLRTLMNETPLVEDKKLYRGVSYAVGDKLQVGSTLVDDAFISTTENKVTASDFGGYVINFTVPAGTPAINVASLAGPYNLGTAASSESEFVLPPGSGFKVVEIIKVDDVDGDGDYGEFGSPTMIIAEYIPPEGVTAPAAADASESAPPAPTPVEVPENALQSVEELEQLPAGSVISGPFLGSTFVKVNDGGWVTVEDGDAPEDVALSASSELESGDFADELSGDKFATLISAPEPETEAEAPPADAPSDAEVPLSLGVSGITPGDKFGYGTYGQYVADSTGTPIFSGSTVSHPGKGYTGTVTQIENNGTYVKVLVNETGKVHGLSRTKLQVTDQPQWMKSHWAQNQATVSPPETSEGTPEAPVSEADAVSVPEPDVADSPVSTGLSTAELHALPPSSVVQMAGSSTYFYKLISGGWRSSFSSDPNTHDLGMPTQYSSDTLGSTATSPVSVIYEGTLSADDTTPGATVISVEQIDALPPGSTIAVKGELYAHLTNGKWKYVTSSDLLKPTVELSQPPPSSAFNFTPSSSSFQTAINENGVKVATVPETSDAAITEEALAEQPVEPDAPEKFVTSVEELDALPVGSVVQTSSNGMGYYHKTADGQWEFSWEPAKLDAAMYVSGSLTPGQVLSSGSEDPKVIFEPDAPADDVSDDPFASEIPSADELAEMPIGTIVAYEDIFNSTEEVTKVASNQWQLSLGGIYGDSQVAADIASGFTVVSTPVPTKSVDDLSQGDSLTLADVQNLPPGSVIVLNDTPGYPVHVKALGGDSWQMLNKGSDFGAPLPGAFLKLDQLASAGDVQFHAAPGAATEPPKTPSVGTPALGEQVSSVEVMSQLPVGSVIGTGPASYYAKMSDGGWRHVSNWAPAAGAPDVSEPGSYVSSDFAGLISSGSAIVQLIGSPASSGSAPQGLHQLIEIPSTVADLPPGSVVSVGDADDDPVLYYHTNYGTWIPTDSLDPESYDLETAAGFSYTNFEGETDLYLEYIPGGLPESDDTELPAPSPSQGLTAEAKITGIEQLDELPPGSTIKFEDDSDGFYKKADGNWLYTLDLNADHDLEALGGVSAVSFESSINNSNSGGTDFVVHSLAPVQPKPSGPEPLPSVPYGTVGTSPSGQPYGVSANGKPLLPGTPVSNYGLGASGVVKTIEKNGKYAKVTLPDGSVKGWSINKLWVTDDSVPHTVYKATNFVSPTVPASVADSDESPVSLPKLPQMPPPPTGEVDPDSPWFQQPKPEPPTMAEMGAQQWVTETWVMKVKQRYADFPGKAKPTLEQSNNWNAVNDVITTGSDAALKKLHAGKYIDNVLLAEAQESIKTAKSANASAQSKHDAAMKQYVKDLSDWKAANGVVKITFPGLPANSTQPFTGGAADWDKAHPGTPTANAALTALREGSPDLARHGVSFAFGGSDIEDLDVRAIRVLTQSGQERIELKMRLTAKAGDALTQKLTGSGVTPSSGVAYYAREIDKNTGLPRYTNDVKWSSGVYDGHTFKVHDAETGTDVEFYREQLGATKINNKAPHNAIRIFAPTTLTGADFAGIVERFGLQNVRPAREVDIQEFAYNKLISVAGGYTNPTQNYTSSAKRSEMLQMIRDKYDIGVEDMVFTTGPSGRMRFFLSDSAVAKLRTYTGVDAFYHNVSGGNDLSRWTNILSGPQAGLHATDVRWSEGISASGMSSDADMESEGAHYVFTKVIHGNIAGSVGSHTVVIHPVAGLRRLDVYGNQGDNYGKHNSSTEVYDLMKGNPYEIMFKHTVPLTDMWFVRVGQESQRKALLQELMNRGITEIGGVPIEQFIAKGSEVPVVDESVWSLGDLPSVGDAAGGTGLV